MDYTEGILFNKIVITCYFTYGILLLIILRESCLIMLWSRASLLMVYCYWLYWWYIITDYTEGVLFNICDHVLLYSLYSVTDCTDFILLLVILRESCLIIWSRATLILVFCYWLYWWYILLLIILRVTRLITLWAPAGLVMVYYYWFYCRYITGYTEGNLFNSIVIMC